MYLLDETDRAIINQLQGDFSITARPFAECAVRFDIDEGQLLARIDRMLQENVITRFGPMYQIEKLGGAFTLAAMKVPAEQFDRVAAQVNTFQEVAHNYQRDHEFNMWFVLATATPEGISETIARIETETGLKVFNMPKIKEYFIGARFGA
jgi:DNA-binding Lrp family transcriptional regulator